MRSHLAVLLQIPTRGNVTGSTAALAFLLGVGPFDLTEIDGHVFRGKLTAAGRFHTADDAVGHFVFHELDFVGAGAADLDRDVGDMGAVRTGQRQLGGCFVKLFSE